MSAVSAILKYMSAFNTIAIIYNPNSTGDAVQEAKRLQSQLRKAFKTIDCTLLPTERAGHAVELAYDFARSNKSPLIISASGDGGYHEVVNGALQAQEQGARPICAVLPAGNANDHARTMHGEPLIDLIRTESVVSLDILHVSTKDSHGDKSSRFAHSYIGLGLTPTVAVELNKHTLNSIKEAWIIIRTFWGLRPVRITIGGKTRKIDSLICSIIPEMAKVLTIAEDANPRDGLFEITTFPHNRKIKLLYRLARGIVRELGAKRRADTFTFTLLTPSPLQLDGEVMELSAGSEVEVKIHPRLLRSIANVKRSDR